MSGELSRGGVCDAGTSDGFKNIHTFYKNQEQRDSTFRRLVTQREIHRTFVQKSAICLSSRDKVNRLGAF